MKERAEQKQVEAGRCTTCGMVTGGPAEYHPHTLCLLVKARNGDTAAARKEFAAVLENARSAPGWLEHMIDTFIANVRRENA